MQRDRSSVAPDQDRSTAANDGCGSSLDAAIGAGMFSRRKFRRFGENRRTLYGLRHSYISCRLLERADIYQIAKNCRTSVEMIEKHYAVHLKSHLDTAAIDRRKGRLAKRY
jgi:integrase